MTKSQVFFTLINQVYKMVPEGQGVSNIHIYFMIRPPTPLRSYGYNTPDVVGYGRW